MSNTSEILPLEDKITVLPDPPAKKTEGGLDIPDTAQEYPNTGIVLSVGEGIPDYPMLLKPGYRVWYGKSVGSPMVVDGMAILVMRQSDCLLYKDEIPIK